MPWVKILMAVLFVGSITQNSFANEHEAPAGEHEGGGEHGGGEHGGGEHGAKAPEAPYSGKQSQEWSEVQTKLSALKGKVDAQEAVVRGLIPKGPHSHAEAPAEGGGEHGGGHEAAAPAAGGEHGGGHGGAAAPMDPAAQIAQLKKEEEKLKKLKEDYEKLNKEYETRFPEKGIKENRIYKRVDPQTTPLEEKASSYDAGTEHLQNKILKQYPKSSSYLKSPKKSKKTENENKHEELGAKEKTHSGDITEPIILQK